MKGRVLKILECSLIIAMIISSPVSVADTITDLGSKTCSQFRADTSAAAEANIANAKLIESYLKPHGLDKTEPRYWHMSILVHCVLNKKDTMLDGAKILVEELKQPPAKPSRAQLLED